MILRVRASTFPFPGQDVQLKMRPALATSENVRLVISVYFFSLTFVSLRKILTKDILFLQLAGSTGLNEISQRKYFQL